MARFRRFRTITQISSTVTFSEFWSEFIDKRHFFTLQTLIVLFCSQSNKSDKNTSEDDVTHAKNSSPTPDANTKPQTTTLTPSESSQGSEGSEPAPSSSPSVSQHQTVCQLPFLPVMYTQLPNMTSLPRQPQGISVESDGSDLPEGTSLCFALCWAYCPHWSVTKTELFRKRSSNRRNLKTPAFHFHVNAGNILNKQFFENDDVTIITWFSWPIFRQTQIQNDRWLFRFQILPL